MFNVPHPSAFSRGLKLLAGLVLAIGLSGCAVHLAPAYDESIEKDTVELHKNVEKFFEGILLAAPGVRGYQNHKQFYVDTFATMRNLKLRAATRPTPAGLSIALPQNTFTDKATGKTINYSAEMFDRLIQATEIVRNSDETFGLNSTNVPIYRDTLSEIFSAILEYEAALKR